MFLKKLTFPIIIIFLPYIFFDVLLPLYTKELGYTTFQFTILVSVFSISQLIMRLLLGRVSDQYSRRSVFIVSLLFFVAAYLAFSVADSLWILVIARVVYGIASILLTISIFGMITDTNDNFAQKLGRFDSNRNLGGFIGVGLSFYILSKYELLNGWKVLFVVCGAAAAIAFIYSLTLPKRSESQRNINSNRVVLSPEKRKIWMVNMLFCLISSMIVVLLIPYLQAVFNADIKEIAITFILPMLASAFLGSFLGKLGDHMGYRKAITLSTIVSALAISAVVFSFRLSIFAILWTLFTVSWSMFNYSLDAMFLKDISNHNIGDAYGKYSTGSYIGMIIGPTLGGFLFDSFGYTTPYIVFVVSMLLFIPLILTILPKDKTVIEEKRG